MGTASGFFGITYQGAVNGLASQTLSIFNMVRRVITAIACPVCQRVLAPPAQDHPIDRCWCKTVFDYVCPEAVLTEAKVGEFLDAFYKSRFDGPTLSGFECHAYPASEKAWLLQHIAESGGSLDFEALLAQLQEAQAHLTKAVRQARATGLLGALAQLRDTTTDAEELVVMARREEATQACE